MRVLVTGADGFVGQHLLRALAAAGHEPIACGGPHATDLPHRCDLSNEPSLVEVVRTSAPDGVIHLAALSSVGQSHGAPIRTFDVNALGALRLAQAMREHAPRARLVFVSSGEIYGRPPGDEPARESDPARPLSPYAAAKAAAEIAILQLVRAYAFDAVVARPFNHLGRGQAPAFVVPSFARQLVEIARSGRPGVLKVGNLEPVRDFSHVHDVCRAYLLLLEKGEPGEIYNIGSGEGQSIARILDALVELSGASARPEVDPARVRKAEIPVLVANTRKIEALGFERQKSVRDALQDVIDEAREAITA